MAITDCKPLPQLAEKDIKRFWKYVDVRSPDECWPWTGCMFKAGYGLLKVRGRKLKSHRIAIFLYTGKDPFPFLTCHSCDNKPCCNGLHLFPGTPANNHDDMKKKGRSPTRERHGTHKQPWSVVRGERVNTAKLSAAQVIEIRRLYALGGISQTELARQFGVQQPCIGQIVLRNHWKHIP